MKPMERKLQKLLRQVSPNVILLDIMPFYIFNIRGVNFNFTTAVKHLYGYFKLDVLRNHWVIFRTISFKPNWNIQQHSFSEFIINTFRWFSLPEKIDRILLPGFLKGTLYYDVLFKQHLSNKRKRPRRIIKELNLEFNLNRKLRGFHESKNGQSILSMVENLYMYCNFEEPGVIKYSLLFHNCKHLKKLKLIGYYSSLASKIISDTVFQRSKFPELQILSIRNGSSYLKGIGWNPIQPLKTLILNGCFWIQNDLFKTPSLTFPQLEHLIINSYTNDLEFTVPNLNLGQNWGIFPNLKFLLLEKYYAESIPISLHSLLTISSTYFPKLEILLLFEIPYIMELKEEWKIPSTLQLLYYSMECADVGGRVNKKKFFHERYSKQVKVFGEKIWKCHNNNTFGNGLYNVCNTKFGNIQSVFVYYKKNTLKKILEHQWIPGLHSKVTYFDHIKIKLNQEENGVLVKWPWIDFDAPLPVWNRHRAPPNDSNSDDSDSDDSPNDDYILTS